MNRRRTFVAAAAALAATAAAGLRAQPAPAQYDGPDREKRLAQGARREGGLNVYTSMTDRDIAELGRAFEKKYGVKVNAWRGGKHKVLQRTIAEGRAGRFEVDVVQGPSVPMEAIRQEKLLQPVRSPYLGELGPGALPAHGEWVGLRAYVFVQLYNTRKVARDELPRSFEELLHPRWKGRLGVEAKEQEWLSALAQQMGEDKALRFMRDLVARNGLSIRSGNSVLTNLVVSGEVPFALAVYGYLAERARARGAPVDWIALQPTIAYTDGIGVARRAPHPHAAALFYDFMLSDGQLLMKAQGHLTMHRRDAAALAAFRPVLVDPERALADYDKWTRIYENAIAGRT